MESITVDYHVHTDFSDGSDIRKMAEAAVDAGLETVGFADHCVPYEDRFDRSDRYDFDETYRQRREVIRELEADFDLEILDGAEINYDPDHEEQIAQFLDEAEFDYVIGSIHYADEYNFSSTNHMVDFSQEEKQAAVDTYVNWQCKLVQSELFDIVGHLDFPQRKTLFQGLMSKTHYKTIAQTLAESYTRPEINAGELNRENGQIHPHPEYLGIFTGCGIAFTIGSDSHTPLDLDNRIESLYSITSESSVEVANL